MNRQDGKYRKKIYASQFKDVSDEQVIFDLFLLTSVKYNSNTRGVKWLEVKLQDNTGFISGRIWADKIRSEYETMAGKPVFVKGTVNYYAGRPEITIEMLRETLGQVDIDPVILGPVSGDIKPKAPGMKYRHYAPKADMTLVEGDMDKVVAYINEQTKKAEAEGKKVGIICTEESRDLYPDGNLEVIGSREHEETVAHNLFAVLRDFDACKVDCIFSESFSKDQLGQAIMNRLCKAAGYHIINV